jgi:hypothetical protein
MINNKFNILRRDLLKNLYQAEPTSNTHIPVYLNKNQEELIGNAVEEIGSENDQFVLILQEDARKNFPLTRLITISIIRFWKAMKTENPPK